MEMTDKQLKPCPFCGSTDISGGEILGYEPNGQGYSQSVCNNCGGAGPYGKLRPGEVDYGSEKANAAWNRRVTPADQESIYQVLTGINQWIDCEKKAFERLSINVAKDTYRIVYAQPPQNAPTFEQLACISLGWLLEAACNNADPALQKLQATLKAYVETEDSK